MPKLISSPNKFLFEPIVFNIASTVSDTYKKSLLVLTFPSFISSPFNAWLMIVGMTALKDCLGPKLLKGLKIIIGKSNE